MSRSEVQTWVWNLGVASLALTACGRGSGSDDSCYYSTDGFRSDCRYDDDYGYDYDPGDYEDHDDDDPVFGCRDDGDCPRGYCSNGGSHSSECIDFPTIPACPTERPLEISWVRQGEGSGTAAGVIGRSGEPQTILMVDADGVALGLARAESDAELTALPFTPEPDELAIGLESADVDADGDDDLLLALRGESTTRLVSLILEDEGSYRVEEVRFDALTGPAHLRRDSGGGMTVLVHTDAGQLSQVELDDRGVFGSPTQSPWGQEVVYDFAVAPVQTDATDDVVTLVQNGSGSHSVVDALIGGIRFAFGLRGDRERRIHADPLRGHLVTTKPVEEAARLQRFFAGENPSVDEVVVTQGAGTLQSSAMTDLDGDGQGDLVLQHREPFVHVVFAVSSADACVQTVPTSATLDTLLVPSSGTGRGVIVAGDKGVLAIRAPD